jgi:hypothetical protein
MGPEPDFASFTTYAIVSPLGVFVNMCVLACSAWLSAVARSWRGWTAYVALAALALFPLTSMIVDVRMHPPGQHSGLGIGLTIALVGFPLVASWLLGSLIGLLFRVLRPATREA